MYLEPGLQRGVGGESRSLLLGNGLSEELQGHAYSYSNKEFAMLEAGDSVLSPPMNHNCSELCTRP